MGLLARLLRGPFAGPNAADDFWYSSLGTGTATVAGLTVGPDSALKASAVWACVRLLAESVAGLPLVLYRRLAAGGKERAIEHPLYEVLRDRPNSWQTAFEFFAQQQMHLLLRGNAYAQIVPGLRGAVDQLVPLHPDRVAVERLPGGGRRYRVHQGDGTARVLLGDELWHVLGLTLDGVTGLSVIAHARETIGLALATETYGARLFGQGARPGGVIKVKGPLSDDARKRLRASWQEAYGGITNAHRVAVLDEGMEWQSIGMNNQDAQFLDTRRFQIADIARWFNVPLHMLQETEKTTSWGSGIEQLSLGFVIYSLLPWLRRWEQRIKQNLIVADGRYFAEFLVDGLLRGDAKTRYDAYATGRQWGWLSVNDVRRGENLNPIGPDGDLYLQPLNMVPIGSPLAPGTAPPGLLPPGEERAAGHAEAPTGAVQGAAAAAMLPFARDAAARVARREAAAMGKASRRASESELESWAAVVREFYAAHAAQVAEQLHLSRADAQAYAERRCRSLLAAGPGAVDEEWELAGADELETLALEGLEARMER